MPRGRVVEPHRALVARWEIRAGTARAITHPKNRKHETRRMADQTRLEEETRSCLTRWKK